jgi:ribonucleoside-diphosphate reductase alpha chain
VTGLLNGLFGRKIKMDSVYEQLSSERKAMQAAGNMPEWWSTGGWQLFKGRYMYKAKNPKEQFKRIAHTLAKHIDGIAYPDWWNEEYGISASWSSVFFDEMWSGRLSPSTPVLSNTGTERGMPVSCSGNVMPNSIEGIYEAKKEIAVLTKNSFGTASYLGYIQARGTMTTSGVTASGVVPVIQGVVQDMDYVSQGQNRRGAWAAYLPLMHADFKELVSTLEEAPDGLHIGWCVDRKTIDAMENDDPLAIEHFQMSLTAKMKTGKGYYFFPDKVRTHRPQMYKDLKLEVIAPQLCNEIHLHSSEEYTYTCVLSSQNLVHWDTIKKNKSTFVATVFLDCVAAEFLRLAKGVKSLEKAVAFTEKSRALGLGVCGFHTYLQINEISFEGMEAHMWNNEVFNHMKAQSLEASQWMAQILGEPEWCKGYGLRNTHRLTCPPTKSTALLMGGISEGINPDPAMTYTQLTPAGEVDRVNPVLLAKMKQLGVHTEENMQEVVDASGSVQKVDWLSERLKVVFRTGFEVDQRAILRMAAQRQRRLCQGQSLNLFVSADETEEFIAELHSDAFKDPWIFGLYYCYSKAGVTASKGECEVCQ